MGTSKKGMWARIEAVTIALVFMAASLALALHVQHKGSPSYGDFPSPPAAVQPLSPHRGAAPPTSGSFVQAHFEQPSTSTQSSPNTPGHQRAPAPKAPAGQTPQGVWT